MTGRRWIESIPVGVRVGSVAETRTVMSGWAGAYTVIEPKRRLVDILLPGDVFVTSPSERSHLVALSHLQFENQSTPDSAVRLAALRAQESRLHRQVIRLGSLSARNRLAHLLLDFHDRLTAVHLVGDLGFRLPMTQDQIADFLGMTVVHLNRSLQGLRKAGLVTVSSGRVRLPEADAVRMTLGGAG